MFKPFKPASHPHPSPRRGAVWLGAIAIITVAACGGDDDNNSADSAPANTVAPATTATPPEPTTDTSAAPPDTTTAPSPTAAPDTTTPETAPPTIDDAPAVSFGDQRIVVLGTFDVWPNLGNLLELGVTPDVYIRAPDSGPVPDYFAAAYGDRLDGVEEVLFDLNTFNFEAIAALEPDVLVIQQTFEPFIDDGIAELLGGRDRLLFVNGNDWRAGFEQIAVAGGADPAAVLAPYQAEYEARLDELRASIDYDPTQLTYSSFGYGPDSAQASVPTSPIALTMTDLGFQLNPAAFPEVEGPLLDDSLLVSFERLLDFDADIVTVQSALPFEQILNDPIWSLSNAARLGNVFEQFQYGTQGGWQEQLLVLDDLAEYLPQYNPGP